MTENPQAGRLVQKFEPNDRCTLRVLFFSFSIFSSGVFVVGNFLKKFINKKHLFH